MNIIQINPTPLYRLSPYLFMQFAEPLGTTDTSIDAAWDFMENKWQPRAVEIVKRLAPPMLRWGGCFASYYHWEEGVGPHRVPMQNLCWDGIYLNQVGTAELAELAVECHSELLFCVNFESDGRMNWARPANGENRLGTADEAAGWVRYCNDPDNALRKSHGHAAPFNVRYWQIGNETSYDKHGYALEKAVDTTRRFAKAAREADPDVNLIAWGDSGWAPAMCEAVGSDVSHIAFHYHFGSALPDSPLRDTEYRRDPSRTWEHLMSVPAMLDAKIREMKKQVAPSGKRLAMTEGHFALPGRNRCDVLSSWMAGVAYARNLNVIFRHSDVLDIATMADFFGNRWQVNAILIPTPHGSGKPYLQPVGHVMRLFGKHRGEYAVDVCGGHEADVTASVEEDGTILHCLCRK